MTLNARAKALKMSTALGRFVKQQQALAATVEKLYQELPGSDDLLSRYLFARSGAEANLFGEIASLEKALADYAKSRGAGASLPLSDFYDRAVANIWSGVSRELQAYLTRLAIDNEIYS